MYLFVLVVWIYAIYMPYLIYQSYLLYKERSELEDPPPLLESESEPEDDAKLD